MHGLIINGVWNIEPEAIKQEVHQFFKDKFYEKWPVRPKFINPGFKTLSPAHCSILDAPISHEEIKQAIWCCGGDKSPGPDGYTLKVLKKKWDLIK